MTTTVPRHPPGSRLLLDLVLLLARSRLLQRAPRLARRVLHLGNERPDRRAQLKVPGFEAELNAPAGDPPDELNLVNGPQGTPTGDLTIATTPAEASIDIKFPGGAGMKVKSGTGFNTTVWSAASVCMINVSTVLPIIVADPQPTGFLAVFIPIGSFALSALLIVLAHLDPRGSRSS